MKNKWKVAVMTGALLTPAAVALADEPENTTPTTAIDSVKEATAIKYFKNLSFASSTIDSAFYNQLITEAFGTNKTDERALLEAKLHYIIEYKKLTLEADSLKQAITKLSLTNKTLFTDLEAARTKYDLLLLNIFNLNEALTQKENKVASNTAYADVLTNIADYYSKDVPTLIAGLIGTANQTLLETRQAQVDNIKASGYPALINELYTGSSPSTYKQTVQDAKTKYSLLTIDEQKIVDAQVITDATTYKTVLANAEANIKSAAEFDKAISNLSLGGTTSEDLATLKAQLVAVSTSYNKLTAIQRSLISGASLQVIQPFEDILMISSKIDALSMGNTQSYRDALNEIEQLTAALNGKAIGSLTLTAENATKIIPNYEKYEEAIKDLSAVLVVEAKIQDLIGTEPPTTAEVKAARVAYTALSSNQKKIVMNLKDLVAWENAEKSAAAVDKKIEAIVISAKVDFYKKYAEAQKAYDALNPAIEAKYVTKKYRLDTLRLYAEVVNDYVALNPTDAEYTTKMAAILSGVSASNGSWSEAAIDGLVSLSIQDIKSLHILRNTLLDTRGNTEIAHDLVDLIDGLEAVETDSTQDLLAKLTQYRTTYKNLDATAKKAVSNIGKLTTFEKKYIAPLKVVTLIDALDPLSSDFTKKFVAARKAFNKLTVPLQAYVKNKNILVNYEKISNVMLQINNLSKSKDILADATLAESDYANLIGRLSSADAELFKVLEEKYKPLLQLALARDSQIHTIIRQIDALAANNYSTIGTDIDSVGVAIKRLSSNDKKLITNYITYTTIQKNYKVAQKVVETIDNLPAKESSDYAKKIEAALKAYNKLTEAQRKYVFNYDNNLKPFVAVASLIGDIDNLKSSASNYLSNVQALRERYNALTEAEKAQIYNINKLNAAESAADGVGAVIALINQAKSTAENYLQAIQKARDAYDALAKDQQKQVTNYKDLQAREKDLAPVLELNKLIQDIGIQPTASKFMSKYNTAMKSYEKISLQSRTMLTNEKLLTETYTKLYNMMSQIENIKSSSNTFVADVEAARAAYNALNAELKDKILNIALLEEHELNVRGGAYIDELIRSLKSNPTNVYVQKVQEASEAYKQLSSANKKAVTLYEELKVEEKFIAPVVSAMEAIELLPVSGAKLADQVKKVNTLLAKLTDEQYALITNLNELSNLENVISVVNLIELIKPSDTKYYIGNTKAADIAYNKLSADEKKKVTNYSKLEEALLNVEALDQVTKKISELSYLSSTFFNDIEKLLADYKLLPSALKKQVSNYAVLSQAETDMKAAQKVTALITAIDSSVRTFESKVVAARKALDKLTAEQKALVTNARLLQQYENDLGL